MKRRAFLQRTALVGFLVGSGAFRRLAAASLPAAATPGGVQFIDTSIENGSPLWYETAADGTIDLRLTYDHERSSPNRAAGHFHFAVEARPGTRVTFELKNLDNVWNGQQSSIARELKSAVISPDGRQWRPVALESLPENRVRLHVEMPAPRLHVARTEPYRLSDLQRLLQEIRRHPRVKIETIGQTVEGRELEVVRVGDSRAKHRVFMRARAHPWESGTNWVAEGLMRELLKRESAEHLKHYCLYVLPMANKDGVARGRTRFNLRGKDLNRGWDRPADPELAPENQALERWLEARVAEKRQPHLALEMHNDGWGKLHLSRPPVPQLERHLQRMAVLEKLLREHTWFTEGSTGGGFRNSGTLGDGWLERYGIDAVVHELNCNWIAGLNDFPLARHWMHYGASLAGVLRRYFAQVQP